MTLYIDLETYSPTPIKRGVYRYTEDPDFQILFAWWAIDDGPLQLADTPEAISSIPGLDGTEEIVAHNAQFERICLSRHLGYPVGKYMPPQWFEDTAAIAAAWGLPRRLKDVTKALGVALKDEAGSALIRYFCVPDRNGNRRPPEAAPDRWAEFVAYGRQDVVALREVHQALQARYGGWPGRERDVWLADQKVNDRGIRVDLDLARNAVAAASDNRERNMAEAAELTGLENPNSLAQLLDWLGGALPDLTAESVRKALAGDGLTPVQRRVLEIRQDLALTASKKFQTALDNASLDGRLRGGFQYFGAHTGRWAGRGLQLQNLPRAGFFRTNREGKKEYDGSMEQAAILDLSFGLGASDQTLKALIRPMIMGPLSVCDYSAIEARVVAWLAGEEWALEAFRAGRDIYVETARRMGGGMGRQEGKVAVLALGYGGGVGSMLALGGASLGGESTLQRIVDQWRGSNRNIVGFWRQMERAFEHGGDVGQWVRVEAIGGDRRVVLPSGRSLDYHGVRRSNGRLSFMDPRGFRVDTYGGRLTENVTQAVARDVLADALVRLDRENFRVVGHIHDEVLVEGDRYDEVSSLMTVPPEWAPGLPVAAAGVFCPGTARTEL